MKPQTWHPKVIEDYLEKYYKIIKTRNTARVFLKNFFTTMNEDPDKFLKKPKKQIVETLWEYTKKIENRPVKTQNSMLSFIKKFLGRKRISIADGEWEDMRIRNGLDRGMGTTVKKKTPTQSDVKKILSYASGIRSKALFTLCASSGLRINEALSLTWDKESLDLEERKIFISGDESKGKYDRVTFITPEAAELLELWKPERERSLQTMYKKSVFLREKLKRLGYEVSKERSSKKGSGPRWIIRKDGRELSKEEIIQIDNRVFPMDYAIANHSWIALLKKAGKPYDEYDKNPKLRGNIHYFYNIHSLRRFWFTQLLSDRASEEYVNNMGGHKSLLDESYKDTHSEIMIKKFKEEYDKHLACLTIFENVLDLSGITEDLKAKNDEIQKLKENQKILELTLQSIQNSLEIEKMKNGTKKK